ncbi:pantoate--beta-alanine ligase [Sinimarinibacterium thermocellulolyticum]|uniref:Pantothenate synthetase n=1 Tax=Sinimarinibacterium thermocellulolyticum TaxID=3170016 RepID=A0ABV2A6H8_9GAMM
MITLQTVAELRAQLAAWRRAGERIALVPTMGNLHRGHLRLMEQARFRASRVVASVFVNPLQFGPNEDYERYPRTLAADQAALAAAGVDLLFAPSVAEMYPRGREGLTRVHVPGISEDLDGAHRPGHFDGVATVVSILFNLVQPDVALFGEKDYQQLAVIRQMVADLHLPIEIIGVPTERDADGLALSSRNQYLSAEERARAPALYAALQAVASALMNGRRDFDAISEEQCKMLTSKGFDVQYLAIRRADLGAADAATTHYVVLVAAKLGTTRLIDNLQVHVTGI